MKHDYEHEVIVNRGKKYGNYILLKSATLVSTCKHCEKQLNEYVAGGVVFEQYGEMGKKSMP